MTAALDRGDPFDRQLRGMALLGAVAWVLLLAVPMAPQSGDALIERILVLAPLVLVPLGLRLSAAPDARGRHALPFRAACFLQPFATTAAVGSTLLEPGMPAAFTAGIWAAYTAILASWGVTRLVRRNSFSLEELCVDVALVYLPVGGTWFVLSRLGARPMGFRDEIVALTAVHFHFAGFVTPIVAGLAGRVLPARGTVRGAWRIGAVAVVTCPVLIALGISLAPIVEVVSAFALAIALTALSILVAARAARRVESVLASALLVACAASLSVTMALACVHALGAFLEHPWIALSAMVRIHGLVNAFGFALPGLVAWTLVAPPPRAAPDET